MKTLIDSLVLQVEDATGASAFFASPPKADHPSFPYVLLWTSAGGLVHNVLGGVRDLQDRLGVTAVHTTPSNVLVLMQRVRDALVGFRPVSDTWAVESLRPPFDSQPVQVDRDVSFPNVGFPHWCVDLYRLDGVPLTGE